MNIHNATISRLWRSIIVSLVAGIGAINAASAQTITVTTSRDVIDVPATATVADLPGPDGVVSFNEALMASDNTPGRQTVGFAIPEDDWWLSDIYPGQVLLQSSFGWSAQQPVIIDGTTQTAFTGDTFAGGNEMALDGLGLGLGDESELFGFHGSRVGTDGSNCDFHDNTGDMYITAGFGNGNYIHDNEAWTIALTYSDNNVVVRNTTERVRITGLNETSPATGNRIGGPDPADRNFITGFGNYGEHGVPNGDCIELFYTNDTLIQNNYIGTLPDGMTISNAACTTGIAVESGNHNLLIRDNLIAIQSFGVGQAAGIPFGQALYLDMYLGGTGIEIVGNTFGLNALGQPVLGSVNGIYVSRYVFEFDSDVRIGGPKPGAGNVIAGHLESGVMMVNGPGVSAIGSVRVSGNSIYDNGDIGIDLTPNTWTFGHTPNDPLDADDGANGLQNFPVIMTATSDGQTTNITGELNSEPSNQYTLEFFASPKCDASGFGQGKMFLGSTNVATDSEGNATFNVDLLEIVPANWVVTSTATHEPVGATSEFSECQAIQDVWFAPESFTVTRGTYESGSIADLAHSDNIDLTARRNPSDVLSQVFVEIEGISPTQSPASFDFTLEAAVFARSTVVQSIDLYNFDTNSWEQVDSIDASRFSDSTTTASATGDLSRFVQNGSDLIRARCRFESPKARQKFSANIDQAVWTIVE